MELYLIGTKHQTLLKKFRCWWWWFFSHKNAIFSRWSLLKSRQLLLSKATWWPAGLFLICNLFWLSFGFSLHPLSCHDYQRHHVSSWTSSPRKPHIHFLFTLILCVPSLAAHRREVLKSIASNLAQLPPPYLLHHHYHSNLHGQYYKLSPTVYMCKQLKPSSLSSKFVRDSIVIIIKNLKIMSSWYDVKAVFKSSSLLPD